LRNILYLDALLAFEDLVTPFAEDLNQFFVFTCFSMYRLNCFYSDLE